MYQKFPKAFILHIIRRLNQEIVKRLLMFLDEDGKTLRPLNQRGIEYRNLLTMTALLYDNNFISSFPN